MEEKEENLEKESNNDIEYSNKDNDKSKNSEYAKDESLDSESKDEIKCEDFKEEKKELDSKEEKTPTEEDLEEDSNEKKASKSEELEKERDTFKELAFRTQADFTNYKKRVQKEKEDDRQNTKFLLLQELLPIFDHLDLALQAGKSDEKSPLFMGLKMIRKQCEDFFQTQGVKEIESIGKEFSHSYHHAISQETNEKYKKDHISREIRKGYLLGERLLRPSDVIVSLGKEEEEEKEKSQKDTEEKDKN